MRMPSEAEGKQHHERVCPHDRDHPSISSRLDYLANTLSIKTLHLCTLHKVTKHMPPIKPAPLPSWGVLITRHSWGTEEAAKREEKKKTQTSVIKFRHFQWAGSPCGSSNVHLFSTKPLKKTLQGLVKEIEKKGWKKKKELRLPSSDKPGDPRCFGTKDRGCDSLFTVGGFTAAQLVTLMHFIVLRAWPRHLYSSLKATSSSCMTQRNHIRFKSCPFRARTRTAAFLFRCTKPLKL